MSNNQELNSLAKLFLKLGFTAFGGPAAHIAMMRREVVIQRKWMTDQQFLDLMGATGIFAWLYKTYGQLPQLQPFFYGIKPAIIAIILAAIFPLAKNSLKSMELAWIGIVVLIFSLLKFNEIYLMFGAGFFSMALFSIKNKKDTKINSLIPFTLLL